MTLWRTASDRQTADQNFETLPDRQTYANTTSVCRTSAQDDTRLPEAAPSPASRPHWFCFLLFAVCVLVLLLPKQEEEASRGLFEMRDWIYTSECARNIAYCILGVCN